MLSRACCREVCGIDVSSWGHVPLTAGRGVGRVQLEMQGRVVKAASAGGRLSVRNLAFLVGIHHASELVCVLPSQSREIWIGVLVIAC